MGSSCSCTNTKKVAINPDDNYLEVISTDGQIRVYSMPKNDNNKKKRRHTTN